MNHGGGKGRIHLGARAGAVGDGDPVGPGRHPSMFPSPPRRLGNRGRDATEWRRENLFGILRAHLLAGWVTQADVAEFRRLSGHPAREPITPGAEAAEIDAFLRPSWEFTETARQR